MQRVVKSVSGRPDFAEILLLQKQTVDCMLAVLKGRLGKEPLVTLERSFPETELTEQAPSQIFFREFRASAIGVLAASRDEDVRRKLRTSVEGGRKVEVQVEGASQDDYGDAVTVPG